MSKENKVLITEGHFRTMLSVCRSLAKKGILVYVVGDKETEALVSKYSYKKFVINSNASDFYEKLLDICFTERITCIFSHLEKTTFELYKLLNSQYATIDHISLVRPISILGEKIIEKDSVLDHVKDIVPVPFTTIIDMDKISKNQFIEVLNHYIKNYKKVILKSVSEIGKSYGPYNRFIVISQGMDIKNILYAPEFEKFILENRKLILQEYVNSGFGVGIGGFWYAGELVCGGGHRRVVQSHKLGGISLVAESFVHPLAYDIAVKIMKKLNYTGIGMVEFKISDDGNIYFMEINPRIWGTLPLYVYSGADIPYVAYTFFTTGQIPSSNAFENGKKMIFFYDYLMSLYTNYKKKQMNKLEFIKQFYLLLKYLLIAKEGSLQVSDYKPFLVNLLNILKSLFRTSLRRIFIWKNWKN